MREIREFRRGVGTSHAPQPPATGYSCGGGGLIVRHDDHDTALNDETPRERFSGKKPLLPSTLSRPSVPVHDDGHTTSARTDSKRERERGRRFHRREIPSLVIFSYPSGRPRRGGGPAKVGPMCLYGGHHHVRRNSVFGATLVNGRQCR